MPLVLALGACLGCATLPAAAQTLVTLHVATTPIDTGAQVYNAIDIGFFRAASMSRSCPNPNSMRPTTAAPRCGCSAHRGSSENFQDVMSQTARWANTHRTESAVILKKYTQFETTPTAARIRYADRLNRPTCNR